MTPEQFTAALAEASVAINTELTQAFREGTTNVRDKWKKTADASSGAHAPDYASHISASIKTSGRGVETVVGPWMSGQGSLGSVLEFGSKNNPAHLDGQNAVEDEMPNMERRFDAVIGFLLP